MRTDILLMVVVGGCTASPSIADSILYGSANDHLNRSELIYTIDQSSGQAAVLGQSGLGRPLDLTSDWRSESFRLWATNASLNELIEIDPLTGAGSVVGGFGSKDDITSLAFDVTTDRLFGSSNDGQFYSIDPSTAEAVLVGSIGFNEVFSLAFDLSGELYGVADTGDWLFRIDPASGRGTAIANIIDGITGIAARPEDGVMFAIDTPTDSVHVLNLETGATTLVGPYGAGVNFMVGLAFSPVPEPTTAIMLSLGILATSLRRR